MFDFSLRKLKWVICLMFFGMLFLLPGCVSVNAMEDEMAPLRREYTQLLFTPDSKTDHDYNRKKEERLNWLMAEMMRLKRLEKEYGLMDREKLEKQLKKNGQPVDVANAKLMGLTLNPLKIRSGTPINYEISYQAYGGGIDTPPVINFQIFSGVDLIGEFPLPEKTYTGQNVAIGILEIPQGIVDGDYTLKVVIVHASATDSKSDVFTVASTN